MSPSAMTLDFDILAFCNDIQNRDLPLSQTRFFSGPSLSCWVLLEAIDLGFDIDIGSSSEFHSWTHDLSSCCGFNFLFILNRHSRIKYHFISCDRNSKLMFVPIERKSHSIVAGILEFDLIFVQ